MTTKKTCSSMSRLRRSGHSDDASKIADAVEVLVRDGAASVTVEPLADLKLAGARELVERWPSIPEALRLDIVKLMDALAAEDVRLNFERALVIGLHDSSPNVRLASVNALWESESTAYLTTLLARVPEEPDAGVRTAMVEALGQYARRASDGLLQADLHQQLEQLLVDLAFEDPHERTRLAAMAAAAYFRPGRLEAEIRRAFDDGHDEAVESALRAMGRFGGERWATRVIDALRAGDTEQRLEAAAAAPYVEDRRVLPYLYEAAEDDEAPELQLAAVQALGEIGGPAVQSFLESFRDSTTGAVADAAEEALENAALLEGAPNAVPIH